MRVFIAIDIKESIIQNLSKIRNSAIETLGRNLDVKWVNDEHIHLTLQFLGDLKDDQVVAVCNEVKEIAKRYGHFHLIFEGVGCFGRPARVVWAGVKKMPVELVKLQQDIANMSRELGIYDDNRLYEAHVTLGRVRSRGAGYTVGRFIEEFGNPGFGRQKVSEIKVYCSDITSEGPTYSILCTCPLKR